MHPYIEIFGRNFPTYGLCCALGALFAILAACFIAGRKISREDSLFAVVYGILFGFLGAKVLYLLTILPEIGRYELKDILLSGFVFYGGIPGGVLGVWVYCRSIKQPLMPVVDQLACCLPLGHAFGRVGCHLCGCCYGMPYDGPLHTMLDGVARFPVQLTEASLLVLLSAFLLARSRKERPTGQLLGLYCCIYAVMRFCLEFLRGDAIRGFVLFFSTSQWISVFAFVFGLWLLLWRKKSEKTV